MSSYTSARREQRPEDYTNVECTSRFCTMKIQNQYYDNGIMFCQDHALDIWLRVQELVNPKTLAETAYAYLHPPEEQEPEPKALPRSEWQGHIYYLRIGEFIKIGFATNVHDRLKAYPPDAELIGSHEGSYTDEQDIHKVLAPSRAHRREWYRLTRQVQNLIDEIPAKAKRDHQRCLQRMADMKEAERRAPREWPKVRPGHGKRDHGNDALHKLPPVVV